LRSLSCSLCCTSAFSGLGTLPALEVAGAQ
jgi:hypothetical protein